MKKRVMKMIATAMVLGASMAFVGCTSEPASSSVEQSDDVEMVKVKVQNGNEAMIDIEIEKDPQKVVTLDYISLDMLVSWGLLDQVVGSSHTAVPDHLVKYLEESDIVGLGGLKEVDMEGVMSLQPDLIFTSGRLAANYDEFAPIAPTVMNNLDYEVGSWESFETIARRNASIFGMEEVVEKQIAEYEARLNTLQEQAKGKTAVIGIMSGGSLSTLGNSSRCSLIGNEIGFENLANDVDSTHGNTSSFELLVQLDPDYIFILDRDAAIETEGASSAKQLMDNELVQMTQAHKNDNIVYLNNSAWYLCEGGILAMDTMLSDVESAFK